MEIQNKEGYGKDENSLGGRDARWHKSSQTRVGIVRDDSFPNGAEQIGITQEDNSWGHPNRECTNEGENDIGKIIERLDKLQEEHLTYLHSHQERLKTRLTESEVQELKFLDKANQIRADIYDLVANKE
jgi:hypothetical protein